MKQLAQCLAEINIVSDKVMLGSTLKSTSLILPDRAEPLSTRHGTTQSYLDPTSVFPLMRKSRVILLTFLCHSGP